MRLLLDSKIQDRKGQRIYFTFTLDTGNLGGKYIDGRNKRHLSHLTNAGQLTI